MQNAYTKARTGESASEIFLICSKIRDIQGRVTDLDEFKDDAADYRESLAYEVEISRLRHEAATMRLRLHELTESTL